MWIDISIGMPSNDYEYKCFVLFNDGYTALSDGHTVHDNKGRSIIAWMPLRSAAKYLPKKVEVNNVNI